MNEQFDPQRTLEWLCRYVASTGSRFYPPEETANECLETIYDDDESVPAYDRGVENGQHARAWIDAVEFFVALECRGFDPVAMTERSIDRASEQGRSIETIDWTWLEQSRYRGQIPDDS